MGRRARLGPFGFERAADVDAAERAMRDTGVLDLAARPLGELSGGERRARAHRARAGARHAGARARRAGRRARRAPRARAVRAARRRASAPAPPSSSSSTISTSPRSGATAWRCSSAGAPAVVGRVDEVLTPERARRRLRRRGRRRHAPDHRRARPLPHPRSSVKAAPGPSRRAPALRLGPVRARLPGGLAARAAPGVRRVDGGVGGGARHLHGRPRRRRPRLRQARRRRARARSCSTAASRRPSRVVSALTPLFVARRALALRRRRRHARARARRRHRGAPRPRRARPRPADAAHGRHAAGRRAGGHAPGRRRPPRSRRALRRQHARRRRRRARCRPSCCSRRSARDACCWPPAWSTSSSPRSPCSLAPRASDRARRRRRRRRAREPPPPTRRRRRAAVSPRFVARRRGAGRLRLPADGAGLVPHARAAPRRLVVHLRPHPRRRARRHRRRRRRLRAVWRPPPGHAHRLRAHLRRRGRRARRPLRARRSPRRLGGDAAPARLGRLLRLRRRLDRHHRHRRLPGRLRLGRAVSAARSRSTAAAAPTSAARSATPTRGTPPAPSPARSPAASASCRCSRRPAAGGSPPRCSPRSASSPSRSRDKPRLGALAAPILAAGLALGLLVRVGPTAAWRHGSVGVGRAPSSGSPNSFEDWARDLRRNTRWQADGVESSVALNDKAGLGLRRQRQGRRQRALRRLDAGDGRPHGHARASRRAARARRRPRHRLDRRLARRGADHGARRRRRARAGHPRGRAPLRAGQPRRARQPEGPRHHRRRARGRRHHARALRPHLLRAVEPVSRRHRQPVHARVLPGRLVAPRRRRPLRAVAAGLQRRRADHPHHLRHARRRCSPTSRPGLPRSRTSCSSPASDRSSYDVAKLRARIAEEPWQTALARVWRADDLEAVFARYVANAGFARAPRARSRAIGSTPTT